MKEWNVLVQITLWLPQIKQKCMTPERSHVFLTVTHVQSCNLQRVTTTLAEATRSSLICENPLLCLHPDFSDNAASLPLSHAVTAPFHHCVCDQSGTHHPSVAGWCGLTPLGGARALFWHGDFQACLKAAWASAEEGKQKGCNWVDSCNPWVGCGLDFLKKGC